MIFFISSNLPSYICQPSVLWNHNLKGTNICNAVLQSLPRKIHHPSLTSWYVFLIWWNLHCFDIYFLRRQPQLTYLFLIKLDMFVVKLHIWIDITKSFEIQRYIQTQLTRHVEIIIRCNSNYQYFPTKLILLFYLRTIETV